MNSNEAGFTFAEMLVALALTAMLALAGSGVLISTLSASSGLRAYAAEVQRLDVAHSLIRDDLANTQLRLARGPDVLDLPAVFVGRETGSSRAFMEFTRGGWGRTGLDEPRGDQQRIEYILRNGDLIRRAWLRPDPVESTPYVDRVLVSGIEAATVRYSDGRDWFARWPDAVSSLPVMVELKIEFAEDDVLIQQLLVGHGV